MDETVIGSMRSMDDGAVRALRVLVSPESLAEAHAAIAGGAHIVDVKNTREGSLGANFPWIIREIADAGERAGVLVSATLGDLPFAPGTAALAAVGAVVNGARYVKAGLHGVRTEAEAVEVMAAVRRACKEHDPTITVVAAGYADYRRFEGLSPATVVAAAAHARCDVVMLDTAFKDGPGLFDALTTAELDAFVTSAHAAGLHVALAGAIGFDQVAALRTLGVDIVGVRGCVCRNGDRGAAIDADRVRQLVRVCVGD